MAYERFGGELPFLREDETARPWRLPRNVLAFSHGRAALAWLAAARGPFASALVCAYTCPSVPKLFRRLGLSLAFYDYGDPDPLRALPRTAGRCLVVVPAPFGFAPWIDAGALAESMGRRACIVVDAAQTAFGALDIDVPRGGGVLSCPRKALSLGDGALLALDRCGRREASAIETLPDAGDAWFAKMQARLWLSAREPGREGAALALNRKAERALPWEPRRITAVSREHLVRIDRAAHGRRRRRNYRRLARHLRGRVAVATARDPQTPAVPFHLPLLHDGRESLLAALRMRRVFATPLWPDAIHDPRRHPRAADFVRRLLALPVDQRYGDDDMDRLAELVLPCL